MNTFTSLYASSIQWFSVNGMRILFILVGAYLLVKVVTVIANRIIERTAKPNFGAGAEEERKRKQTLIRIIVRTAEVALYLIALMTILSEFGINIAPLIAGAGVLGIAIGFGAQQLVRDVISGLFIVLDNRYHVGDMVKINDVEGIVEDLNLRMTRVRDANGSINYFANGSINSCANLSPEGGRVSVSLKVSSKANIDKVREIVDRVARSFVIDDETKTSIARIPRVVRVESFDADWITLRISGDVMTLKQWDVTSDFKLRLKEALDEAGIPASG